MIIAPLNTTQPLRAYRVLVVDRSLVSCRLVKQVISETIGDVEVVICHEGSKALELLHQHHFDLITTSLLLADMDGLALCRTIRSDEKHRYKPVVVISGDANQRLLREGFAAGVTDYFDKSNGYNAFRQFISEFRRQNGELTGHILYVEDSRTAALVATRIFQKHGLKVTHLLSAEEAYRELQLDREQGQQRFDIVVTDFNLEGAMTGGDLLHAIRTRMHYTRQELPVLIVTGNTDNETQIEIFHAGANDFVSKPPLEEIFIARIRSLLLIKQQYRALKQQAMELQQLSITDKLTGLYNRRYLTEHGQTICDHYRTQPYWVVMADIDHFKRINDTQGHATGDRVIAGIAGVLRSGIENVVAIRYGGEEFALFFRCDERSKALLQLEQLRQQIEQLKPAGVAVTSSFGVVCGADFPQLMLEGLLDLADQALYTAKHAGRNRIYLMNPSGGAELSPV